MRWKPLDWRGLRTYVCRQDEDRGGAWLLDRARPEREERPTQNTPVGEEEPFVVVVVVVVRVRPSRFWSVRRTDSQMRDQESRGTTKTIQEKDTRPVPMKRQRN